MLSFLFIKNCFTNSGKGLLRHKECGKHAVAKINANERNVFSINYKLLVDV